MGMAPPNLGMSKESVTGHQQDCLTPGTVCGLAQKMAGHKVCGGAQSLGLGDFGETW